MIGCDKERFKSIVEDQVRIAMIFYPGHDDNDDDDSQVILKSPEAVLEHLRLSLELNHGHLSSLAASLGLERTR